MIERFSIFKNEEWLKGLLDSIVVDIEPCGPRKTAVLCATGMSEDQLDSFLDSHDIAHSKSRVSESAIPVLREWYLKKMRRFVNNALVHGFEPGSADETLFFQFCLTYSKSSHHDVTSWDDIDEFRLLQDFEAKCQNWDLFAPLHQGVGCLLERIHRSFLFHLRHRRVHKYKSFIVNYIISFILCNRYHIFISDADSFADTTDKVTVNAIIFRFNSPRIFPFVLCPWPNAFGYETEHRKLKRIN